MRTLLAVAALGAVTSVVMLTQSSSSGAQSAPTTLHLTQLDRDFTYVDAPPKGGDAKPPSGGDEFVISGKVVGGGSNNVVCTITHPGPQALAGCTGALVLPAGQITFAGVTTLTNTVTEAVTGGTGRYAGAQGTVISTSSNSGGKTAITVHLRG